MTRKRTLFSVLLLIMCLTASLAAAQDTNVLTYTIPAQGEITNDTVSQTWTLQTASADRITIHVERTSGNLIPELSLLDSNSQQITSSYGDYTYDTADIEDYTLPAGGTYQVLVQRKDADTGVTTGQYSIVVTPSATADDNPNNTSIVGEITPDQPVTGEITGAHWYQRYTYNAQGADVIQLTAKRTDGTLFPQVEVLDANGSNLNIGYTDNTGETASIDRLELPGPGAYTVAMTRNSDFTGYTVGTYELDLTLIGAGEESPLLSGSMGDVAYDNALTGDIGARWYEDWNLVTQAGDTLTISATRTSGNLQPEVILLGGSGQEISHAYVDRTGDGASIDRYQLNGPGTYTVRVSRSNGKGGVTTGGYSLMVSLDGAGDGSASLQGTTGDIQQGTPVDGQITAARWADTWTYTGTKGVVLDITAKRTEGTLVPHVEIRDSNGQTLNSAYPDAAMDTAELTGYALPGDGQYQIVVYRDGEQGGWTTGAYTLTVKPAGQ
jgi:hypothetical protein